MRKLTIICSLIAFIATFALAPQAQAASAEPAYEKGEYGLTKDQYAKFPKPLAAYEEKLDDKGEMDLMETLKYRASELGGFNIVATIIFVCAIIHTFLAGYFLEMAHKHEHRQQKLNEEKGRTASAKPEEDAKCDVSFRAHLFHFLGK